MVDHILEIPGLEVFSFKCFNCELTKLYLQNNPAWNKDDIEVVISFPCLFKSKTLDINGEDDK